MASRTHRRFRIHRRVLEELRPDGATGPRLGRRTFLLGAAALAAGAVPAARAAGKLAISSLRVRTRKFSNGDLRSVTVSLPSGEGWTVDVSRYAPGAKLTLANTEHGIEIALSEARYAGLQRLADLKATINSNVLRHTIRLELLPATGQKAQWIFEGDFVEWVLGERPLELALDKEHTQKFLGGEDSALTERFFATSRDNSKLTYRPDNVLLIDGEGLELYHGRAMYELDSLAVGPAGPADEGLLEGANAARTFLDGSVRAHTRERVSLPAGNWFAQGPFEGVQEVRIETYEGGGAFARIGRPESRLELVGFGMAFLIAGPRWVTHWNGNQESQALSAEVSDDRDDQWLSSDGMTIGIGADPESPTIYLEDSKDELSPIAEVPLAVTRIVPHFDDAIVSMRGHRPMPVNLGLEGQQPQPAPRPIPIQPRPIPIQPRPNPTPTPTPTPTPQPQPQPQPNPGTATLQPGRIGNIQLKPDFTIGQLRLVPFGLDVVRREDMLTLSFEFANLALTNANGQPRLTRNNPNKPAYLIVNFPPQAITEATFNEGPDGRPDPDENPNIAGNAWTRPIDSRMAGESRLVFYMPTEVPYIVYNLEGEDGKGKNGLLDWARLKQNVNITAYNDFGSPWIKLNPSHIDPVDNIRFDISRFKIPAGGIPIPRAEDMNNVRSESLKTIQPTPITRPPLNPAIRPEVMQPVPAVTRQPKNTEGLIGNVAIGIDPTRTFKFIPTTPLPISEYHTRIEMPVRLYISPTELAGWSHVALPNPSTKGRFELWHTRLGAVKPDAVAGNQVIVFSDDGKVFYSTTINSAQGPFPADQAGTPDPVVRAIGALDYDDNDQNAKYGPMIRDSERTVNGQLIWSQTATIRQRHRKQLVDFMCLRGQGNKDTEPFRVENLILTPLGGYLKGQWVWRPPTGFPDGRGPELVTWRHVATLGREHYVKLVERGYLFPTGHKAVKVTISERKFQTTAQGKVVAYMRRRQFVVVRDPLVEFESSYRKVLGFQSLKLLTLETPVLDILTSSDPVGQWGGAFGAGQFLTNESRLQWLYSDRKPVLFNVRGVDMDGKIINFSMPMIFVMMTAGKNPAVVQRLIQEYEKNENSPTANPFGFPRRSDLGGQRVAFGRSDPSVSSKNVGEGSSGQTSSDGNAAYPVLQMLLSAQPFAANPDLDIPVWRPVLHRANIRVPAVEMLQGEEPPQGAFYFTDEGEALEELVAGEFGMASTAAIEDSKLGGLDVKLAEIYKQAEFAAQNKAGMLFELIDKVESKIKDSSKSGGLLNPDMVIRAIGRGKGPLGGKSLDDITNAIADPKEMLGNAAKILGAVSIWEILPSSLTIKPGDDEAPYMEVSLVYGPEGKKKPPTGAVLAVIWNPPIKNWGFPGEDPIFVVSNFSGLYPANERPPFNSNGSLGLQGTVKIDFKGGKPKMEFVAAMKNFRVDILSPASFLYLDFKLLQFKIEVGKSPKVDVDLTKITFTGPLTFIQKLQELFSGDGGGLKLASANNYEMVAADVGFKPFFDVDLSGIKAGFTITIPSFGFGIFAIRNISLGFKLTLPFIGDPLRVRFNFCEQNDPFQLSVMGFTGGGFVAIEIGLEGVERFEAAFEFGGSLSLDIGVASGGVELMAGIYYSMENDVSTLKAYIRLRGHLSVLGIISITITFELSMTYISDGNRLYGTATVTVEIEILFFSVSVSMTVERQLAGKKADSELYAMDGGALPAPDEVHKFTDAMSSGQWTEYCAAFAK